MLFKIIIKDYSLQRLKKTFVTILLPAASPSASVSMIHPLHFHDFGVDELFRREKSLSPDGPAPTDV